MGPLETRHVKGAHSCMKKGLGDLIPKAILLAVTSKR